MKQLSKPFFAGLTALKTNAVVVPVGMSGSTIRARHLVVSSTTKSSRSAGSSSSVSSSIRSTPNGHHLQKMHARTHASMDAHTRQLFSRPNRELCEIDLHLRVHLRHMTKVDLFHFLKALFKARIQIPSSMVESLLDHLDAVHQAEKRPKGEEIVQTEFDRNVAFLFLRILRHSGLDAKSASAGRVMRLLHAHIRVGSRLRSEEVLECMHSLRRMSRDQPEVRPFLSTLLVHLQDQATVFSVVHITRVLVSLKNMSCQCPDVQKIIKVLTARIPECKVAFDSQAVGNTVYGLQNMLASTVEVRDLLVVLTDQIKRCSSHLKPQEYSNALYGMQGFSDYPEVRQLLQAVNGLPKDSSAHFLPQNISNALYGLKKMNSSSVSVRAALGQIGEWLETLPAEPAFKGQDIAMSLLGLQGMSSEFPEVKKLMRLLAPRISACNVLSAQEQSCSFYGLQSMSSDHDELCLVLQALNKKVRGSKDPLNAQGLSNSFYGLQNMRSTHDDVRESLRILTTNLKKCSEVFNAQAIGNILYSFRNFSSSHSEVRDALKVVTKKLRKCPELDPQAISNSLYGLQKMSSNIPEVRAFVRELVAQTGSCHKDFNSQAIANAFYGLNGLSTDHEEVRDLICFLTTKAEQCPHRLDMVVISSVLHGLQSSSSASEEVQRLLSVLTTRIYFECRHNVLMPFYLSMALHGMTNFSLRQQAVVELLEALTLSLHAAKTPMSIKHIGTALFGILPLCEERGGVASPEPGLSSLYDDEERPPFKTRHPCKPLFDFLMQQLDVALLAAASPDGPYGPDLPLADKFLLLRSLVLFDHFAGKPVDKESLVVRPPLSHRFLSAAAASATLSVSAGRSPFDVSKRLAIVRLQMKRSRLLPSDDSIEDVSQEKSTENERKSGLRSSFVNWAERMFNRSIKLVLKSSPRATHRIVQISNNIFLCGCFEADTVIKLLVAASDDSFSEGGAEGGMKGSGYRLCTYNVETDGPDHANPRKQQFYRYRDRFLLEAHKVQVVRINLVDGGNDALGVHEKTVKALSSVGLIDKEVASGESADVRVLEYLWSRGSMPDDEITRRLNGSAPYDSYISNRLLEIARKDPPLSPGPKTVLSFHERWKDE